MSTSGSRLLAYLILLLLVVPVRAQEPEPIVRVYVLSRVAPQSITIRATDGPLNVHANREDVPLYTLLPGDSATMQRVGDRIRITAPSGATQATVGEVVPTNGSAVTLSTGTHRRVYHGALSVELDGERRSMRLINYVPVEAYVASVVASEYPFSEPEGVKAQAVLARTYALRAHRSHDSYDLLDDQRSQVYEGEEKATDVTRAATEATRGQVLTYRGELVEALYYSSSGGHTASNEDIWNTSPVPYLRGRPDPFDSAAPDHRWSTSATSGELHRALGQRFGGTVSGFEVASRASSGRVGTVRLLGSRPQSISGSDFRSVVTSAFGARTLRSTNFTAERRGNRYLFNGRGFGHGVGMSQFGARAQAQQGRSYQDILTFYFAGTSIDFRDSAFLERENVVSNAPRRTRPTPRSEAHANRASSSVFSPTPTGSNAIASTGSGTTRISEAETTAASRRTAW